MDAHSLDTLLQEFFNLEFSTATATNTTPRQDTSLSSSSSSSLPNLLSIKPIVFVQQMTIMQHHLYKKIPTSEMLSKKYGDPERCPNLDLMRRWNTTV
jgi:hypothetical protein